MGIKVIDWHQDLPERLHLQGYNQGKKDNQIRSGTGNGIDKRRPRAPMTVTPITGTQVLSDVQFQTLETFFDETLRYGNVAVRWNFRGRGEEDVYLNDFEIVRALRGDRFRVQYDLEVLP